MQKVVGKTIVLTRGDSFKQIIAAKDMDGKPYTPVSGDVIRFAAKRNYSDENLVIEKQIPYDTMLLQLTPDDTKSLEFGTYVYDIQITYSNGDVNTFLDKGTLKLTEEVDGILPPIPAGCQYEMGEWTPEEDTDTASIAFQNPHDDLPIYCVIMRKTQSDTFINQTNYFFSIINFGSLFGALQNSADSFYYGRTQWRQSNNNRLLDGTSHWINSAPDASIDTPTAYDFSYYVSTTELKPKYSMNGYYWRAEETYRWFAVWKPET